MLDDRELTLRCAVGMSVTLLAQVTSATGRLRCLETGNAITVEEHVLAGAVELVPCWADTSGIVLVVEKVFYSEQFWFGALASFAFAPALERSFLLVALLVSRGLRKRWVSPPVISVCNVCVGAGCFDSG